MKTAVRFGGPATWLNHDDQDEVATRHQLLQGKRQDHLIADFAAE